MGVIQMAHGIARWSLVNAIVLVVGPAALAQIGPTATQPVPWSQTARFRMDCGQDLRRLCHGVQPGEGRLIQCLSSHRSELSPACISRLAAARPGTVPPSQNTQRPGLASVNPPTGHAVTASALRASCGPDVQTHCGGMSRDNAGVVKCLSSHRMELSPTCDAFFKEMLARRATQKGGRKTTPPMANGPAAAANGGGDTTVPSATSGPAGTTAPSAVDDAADTGALSATNGPSATPAADNGPTDTEVPCAAPSLANGPADTAAPPAVNSPAPTSALPAANATATTGAAPAAKSRSPRGMLDFPL